MKECLKCIEPRFTGRGKWAAELRYVDVKKPAPTKMACRSETIHRSSERSGPSACQKRLKLGFQVHSSMSNFGSTNRNERGFMVQGSWHMAQVLLHATSDPSVKRCNLIVLSPRVLERPILPSWVLFARICLESPLCFGSCTLPFILCKCGGRSTLRVLAFLVASSSQYALSWSSWMCLSLRGRATPLLRWL